MAKRDQQFAKVSKQAKSARQLDEATGSGFVPLPLNTQATNRNEQAPRRRRIISSILLTISSIDLVCADGMTSKEKSHLEQCQK
jgi:hypothetical protein